MSAIAELDGIMTSFEKMAHKIGANCAHDGSIFKKIKEVTKNIQESKANQERIQIKITPA